MAVFPKPSQLLVTTLVLAGCSSSPLGPSLGGKDSTGGSGVNGGSIAPGDGGSGGGGTVDTPVTPTQLANGCSYDRKVFYVGSTVKIVVTCSSSTKSLTATGLPSFLTASTSGGTMTVTGTATGAAQAYTWTVTADGTDSTVKTTLLATSSLASTLTPPQTFDPSNDAGTTNGAAFDLGHAITLDSTWDGPLSAVTLDAGALGGDLPAPALVASPCAVVPTPFVCRGAQSGSGETKAQALALDWHWSAFDQGAYTLRVTPTVTIEGGQTTLPEQTFSTVVPIQTNGNPQVTALGNPNYLGNAYDNELYRYGVAVSQGGSQTSPAVGLLYMTRNTGDIGYFTRMAVDRTSSPAAAASVSQAGTAVDLGSGANAQDFSVASLADGSWLAIGGVATTGSYDVQYDRIADSATAPSLGTHLLLTPYSGTTKRALSVDATKPFTDGSHTRVGIAYVMYDTGSGTSALTVAKANVSGTDAASTLDDLNYGTSATGGYSMFPQISSASGMDRLRIREIAEGGAPYFYVAYRLATDLMIVKLGADYAGGYGQVGPATMGSGVLANSGTSNLQAIDLALGTSGGATVAGVAYRDGAGNCFFQRADATLTTFSTPLQLNTETCYFPTIAFSADSGRFVVTWAEATGAGNSAPYSLFTVDVKLGSPDTLWSPSTQTAAPLAVVTGLGNYPIKLVTDYFTAGHWMALFYRLKSSANLYLHGFHVSGE